MNNGYMSRPRILGRVAAMAIVGGLVPIATGACSSGPADVGSRSRTTTTTTTTPTPNTSSSTVVATTPPGPPATEVSSGPPQNIDPSAALDSALRAAFASYQHIPESDIGSTVAGSEHEAYNPPTGTYWAVAHFMPSSTAGNDVVVFQDGGGIGIFNGSSPESWVMTRTGGEPFPCPGVLPPPVMEVWGMQDANCNG